MAGPGWSDEGKYTIAVDFDGVIHSYISPWEAADIIPDPPVLGALPWLEMMVESFRVCIYSTRCCSPEAVDAMRDYLRGPHTLFYDPVSHEVVESLHPWGLGDRVHELGCSAEKPAALIYLDDRAVRFSGSNFPSAEEIHQLHPWNKRPMGLKAV